MKRIKYNILFIFSIAITTIACKKEELLSYVYPPSVYIYKRTATDPIRDSITYSFAIRDKELKQDTVFIPIRIMGNVSDRDRSVRYQVMTSTSADPESYELLPAKIYAGQFEGRLPVAVKRIGSLKEKEGRLWVHLVPSDDFEPGVPDQLRYLIKINDFLSRPESWNDYIFGEYSNVKYDLIIKTTGYVTFAGLGNSEMRFISQNCKNALIDYEREHGTPLLDENRMPVVFP